MAHDSEVVCKWPSALSVSEVLGGIWFVTHLNVNVGSDARINLLHGEQSSDLLPFLQGPRVPIRLNIEQLEAETCQTNHVGRLLWDYDFNVWNLIPHVLVFYQASTLFFYTNKKVYKSKLCYIAVNAFRTFSRCEDVSTNLPRSS